MKCRKGHEMTQMFYVDRNDGHSSRSYPSGWRCFTCHPREKQTWFRGSASSMNSLAIREKVNKDE